jgi:hypothetical protein
MMAQMWYIAQLTARWVGLAMMVITVLSNNPWAKFLLCP